MPPRNYSTGRFFLELEGVKGGFIKSIEGGVFAADVINEPATGFFSKKHIGQPRVEEAKLEVGLAMDKSLYGWITTSWQKASQRKNVSVVMADTNLEARTTEEFANALLTEVTIPACDGSSREPGFLTLKLAPEAIRTKKASGKIDAPSTPNQQKSWVPSNFRLDIPGLDCKKVNKVDSFTVKQSVVRDDVGERRIPQKETRIEFPNLRVTLASSSAATWEEWFDDFVIKGNCDDAHEKSGKLSFLTPTLDTELMSISFINLGIFRLAPERLRAGDQIDRTVADLYCERMEFHWGA